MLRHIAKRWPTRNESRHLPVKHLKTSKFKFLKVIGDGEDKGRMCKK
jgi:hypothetical protein